LSSTTPPRAGSSSTTSPPPRVRVPRHVARLLTRIVAWLVVDYSTSRRLVVDYFAFAVLRVPRQVARLVTRLVALLVVDNSTSRRSSSTTPRRAGSSSTTPPCAGSSLNTSHPPSIRVPRHVARLVAPLVVDYSVSRRLVVDYFASAARPGASARRAARRRQLRLAQARCQLLRLRRASECLGTSRGSSRGSPRGSSRGS
jgi:hypothetical protein